MIQATLMKTPGNLTEYNVIQNIHLRININNRL